MLVYGVLDEDQGLRTTNLKAIAALGPFSSSIIHDDTADNRKKVKLQQQQIIE